MDWYGMTDAAIVAELGKRIKETRAKKRFSQVEVANRSGLSVFTISQIETGKNTSLLSLVAVMRVLKLLENIEDLIPKQTISPVSLLNQQKKKKQ
jgi:Predicted transcriptional regulators